MNVTESLYEEDMLNCRETYRTESSPPDEQILHRMEVDITNKSA